MLRALYAWPHLNPTSAHLTKEETEAQIGEGTCPGPYGQDWSPDLAYIEVPALDNWATAPSPSQALVRNGALAPNPGIRPCPEDWCTSTCNRQWCFLPTLPKEHKPTKSQDSWDCIGVAGRRPGSLSSGLHWIKWWFLMKQLHLLCEAASIPGALRLTMLALSGRHFFTVQMERGLNWLLGLLGSAARQEVWSWMPDCTQCGTGSGHFLDLRKTHKWRPVNSLWKAIGPIIFLLPLYFF